MKIGGASGASRARWDQLLRLDALEQGRVASPADASGVLARAPRTCRSTFRISARSLLCHSRTMSLGSFFLNIPKRPMVRGRGRAPESGGNNWRVRSDVRGLPRPGRHVLRSARPARYRGHGSGARALQGARHRRLPRPVAPRREDARRAGGAVGDHELASAAERPVGAFLRGAEGDHEVVRAARQRVREAQLVVVGRSHAQRRAAHVQRILARGADWRRRRQPVRQRDSGGCGLSSGASPVLRCGGVVQARAQRKKPAPARNC